MWFAYSASQMRVQIFNPVRVKNLKWHAWGLLNLKDRETEWKPYTRCHVSTISESRFPLLGILSNAST